MVTRIDAALEGALAHAGADAPPALARALRYAVFPGGARVRPRLCLAVADAGPNDAPALVEAAACGLELLHCASLVHDDLPCFDDAAERRGKPSVHRAFGEPLAVLVGDALIVLAFETLARAGAAAPARLAGLTGILATAAGTPHGLVAGQAWESEASASLEAYHRAKTASMFVAATTAGALAAGRDPAPWRGVGERLGAAYQVADDLLDAHATPESAGKPTRRDAALARPSAVDALGTDGAVARLRALVAEAAAAVPPCEGAEALRALVVRMAERLVPASLRQSAA
ncbi:MAG TPA: polyprenyl synthetase family protein [Sandaracinaceae bacterium LLY-WYZ-13_1]|nr:polyprenyl synthetase family protein [Sandaracinaceae bacterium LLY-WYZ-13_1]